MFPPGMLLLLMAGNAPAPAVRLSIKPVPAQIPKSLNRPQLPHCCEASIYLEMAGKKYYPNTSSSLGKNVIKKKNNTKFACFPLKSLPPSEGCSPKASIQSEKKTCPAPGYTTHTFLQTALWWCLSELVPQRRNNLGFLFSSSKSGCL